MQTAAPAEPRRSNSSGNDAIAVDRTSSRDTLKAYNKNRARVVLLLRWRMS
jgi:hypothetical protein